jgi:hypothetical protein
MLGVVDKLLVLKEGTALTSIIAIFWRLRHLGDDRSAQRHFSISMAASSSSST